MSWMIGTRLQASDRALRGVAAGRCRVAIGLLVILCSGATGAAEPLGNQLTGHPSPYLRLHAQDPVAWQDWDERAIDRARAENKLLYLSIGYFSCHWCHVMQRDS